LESLQISTKSQLRIVMVEVSTGKVKLIKIHMLTKHVFIVT
jgi:hypothetical protein